MPHKDYSEKQRPAEGKGVPMLVSIHYKNDLMQHVQFMDLRLQFHLLVTASLGVRDYKVGRQLEQLSSLHKNSHNVH